MRESPISIPDPSPAPGHRTQRFGGNAFVHAMFAPNIALQALTTKVPDDAQIESLAVTYPHRGVRVMGLEVHWMIVFFVLSMVFALALRRRFNVVL